MEKAGLRQPVPADIESVEPMTRASEPKKAEKSARERRLAAALRENLRRRKVQARDRASEKPPDEDPAQADKR